MGTPHKHRDLIVQWADGADIQCRISSNFSWEDATAPVWSKDAEYRIKPQTIKYRVALIKGARITMAEIATNDKYANRLEESASFSRWLTDWIEVEV